MSKIFEKQDIIQKDCAAEAVETFITYGHQVIDNSSNGISVIQQQEAKTRRITVVCGARNFILEGELDVKIHNPDMIDHNMNEKASALCVAMCIDCPNFDR